MKFPLTRLIIELMKADRERLQKMDVGKVADYYGLEKTTVESYKNQQIFLK